MASCPHMAARPPPQGACIVRTQQAPVRCRRSSAEHCKFHRVGLPRVGVELRRRHPDLHHLPRKHPHSRGPCDERGDYFISFHFPSRDEMRLENVRDERRGGGRRERAARGGCIDAHCGGAGRAPPRPLVISSRKKSLRPSFPLRNTVSVSSTLPLRKHPAASQRQLTKCAC